MKTVLTIIGSDQVGIVARVSSQLAENKINILDINQNIVNGFFNMVMIVDLPDNGISLKDLQSQLTVLGNDIGVTIKAQHADIFTAMHRI
jgi:ACT domain-containing protein